MAGSKAFKVLIGVGSIVLAIGLGLLGYAALPTRRAETLTIPAGDEWFVVFTFNVFGAGRLSGNSTSRPGGVDVSVFAQGEYDAYLAGESPAGLYSATGIAVSFSVAFPGSGSYYLVFDHGAGLAGSPQQVSVAIQLEAIDPPTFFAGVASLIVAVGLILAGIVRGRRAAMAPSSSPPRFAPPRPVAPPPSEIAPVEELKPPGGSG